MSNEYNRNGEKEFVNLELDLLINRLKTSVWMNMEEAPLETIKEFDNTRKYNHIARKLIDSNCIFLDCIELWQKISKSTPS